MSARTPNAASLGAAASRPGADPRVWVTLATVTELGFDPKEGNFADVQFQPGGEPETAYFGSNYAGKGYGDHNPMKIGDTVLVAIPMGDTGHGPIIIARYNNAGEPPPAEFGDGAEPSKDRIIHVEAGQNLKIIVTGGGNVNISVETGGQLRLGDDSLQAPLQGVVQGEGIDPFTGLAYAVLGSASLSVSAKKGA